MMEELCETLIIGEKIMSNPLKMKINEILDVAALQRETGEVVAQIHFDLMKAKYDEAMRAFSLLTEPVIDEDFTNDDEARCILAWYCDYLRNAAENLESEYMKTRIQGIYDELYQKWLARMKTIFERAA
jgi:hypothetical protein